MGQVPRVVIVNTPRPRPISHQKELTKVDVSMITGGYAPIFCWNTWARFRRHRINLGPGRCHWLPEGFVLALEIFPSLLLLLPSPGWCKWIKFIKLPNALDDPSPWPGVCQLFHYVPMAIAHPVWDDPSYQVHPSRKLKRSQKSAICFTFLQCQQISRCIVFEVWPHFATFGDPRCSFCPFQHSSGRSFQVGCRWNHRGVETWRNSYFGPYESQPQNQPVDQAARPWWKFNEIHVVDDLSDFQVDSFSASIGMDPSFFNWGEVSQTSTDLWSKLNLEVSVWNGPGIIVPRLWYGQHCVSSAIGYSPPSFLIVPMPCSLM